MRYKVNKYKGRILCDSGEFDYFIECMKFADDDFCDRAVIKDSQDNKQYTITIKIKEDNS